jgi:hypothetical protein
MFDVLADPREAKRGFVTRQSSKIEQKIAVERPSEAKRG